MKLTSYDVFWKLVGTRLAPRNDVVLWTLPLRNGNEERYTVGPYPTAA